MENKTIVITGATSGVGEKLVNQFSSKGFNVIALGRDELKLNKLRANNIKCIKAAGIRSLKTMAQLLGLFILN